MDNYIIILIRMNNYIIPHALSDIKSLHVTYYGWHDLPQGLWIINEYINDVNEPYSIIAKPAYRFWEYFNKLHMWRQFEIMPWRPSPIKLMSFICRILFEIGLVFSFALRTINRHWWSERPIRGRCCTYIVVKLWHTG
jgi:hypothetical protein